MRKNPKCYICVYCQQCDEKQEEKCIEMDYALFTTEQDKELCDMICGEIQNED